MNPNQQSPAEHNPTEHERTQQIEGMSQLIRHTLAEQGAPSRPIDGKLTRIHAQTGTKISEAVNPDRTVEYSLGVTHYHDTQNPGASRWEWTRGDSKVLYRRWGRDQQIVEERVVVDPSELGFLGQNITAFANTMPQSKRHMLAKLGGVASGLIVGFRSNRATNTGKPGSVVTNNPDDKYQPKPYEDL